MNFKMKWSERKVGHAVTAHLFERAALVVPNCSWTGSEADLLVVTNDLRIIDVEIKIDRSDLKADGAKDKWVKHHYRKTPNGTWSHHDARLLWPDRVWKHYYVMPEKVWDDSLFEFISPASGVCLIKESKVSGRSTISVKRRAIPNRGCPRISQDDAFSIGRLASLRMWERVMTVNGSSRIGRFRISGGHLRDIRNGFEPSPEVKELFAGAVVLDTRHDVVDDFTEYVMIRPEFEVVRPGEAIPGYDAVYDAAGKLQWAPSSGD